MVRGRKPIPISIKRQNGNPGHRPLGREPALKKVRPEIPPGLDPAAKKFLDVLMSELERVGGLTVVDGPSLFLLAQRWSEVRRLERLIKKLGLPKAVALGVYSQFRKAEDSYRKWAQEYGVTWLSRTRLAIKDDGGTEDDESDLVPPARSG